MSFDEEIHIFYEISAALVYKGEMSTPTAHWRCGLRLNGESENFFSHLTTEDEFSVWPKIHESFSSAYKRKCSRNRTPSEQSFSIPAW